MNEQNLRSLIQNLPTLSADLRATVQTTIDMLTKPQGSLGKIEELALKIALIQNTATPSTDKKRIYCFAGDHGVTAEGISAFPKEVTPQMVLNMAAGGAAINAFAGQVGAELFVVDMGVDFDFKAASDSKQILHHKIQGGTKNFTESPAMSKEECLQALETGINLAKEAKAAGVNCLGTGEMGIGNTTAATALYAHFLGLEAANITGMGTGLDQKGIAHKVEIINKAIEVNQGSLQDPLSALAALGGFEIAGITGLILGACSEGIPVVIDGFISAAAATTAIALAPMIKDQLIFSHLSKEGGHALILEKLEVSPLLSLDLRLGEGTGGAIAMNLVEASMRMLGEMASFADAGVSENN